MQVETLRFGALEISDDAILTFPNGIPAFENSKHWTLLHQETTPPAGNGEGKRKELKETQTIVHYLQSVDDPAITLSVVDPSLFGFDYDMTLEDDDINLMQVKDGDYVAVLLVVGKYSEDSYREGLPVAQNLRANIGGPILLNTRSRIGIQKVLSGLRYNVTFHTGLTKMPMTPFSPSPVQPMPME